MIERAKLQIFSEIDKVKEDSDYRFLVSLLSFLKVKVKVFLYKPEVTLLGVPGS
jgi:hypothetical protein